LNRFALVKCIAHSWGLGAVLYKNSQYNVSSRLVVTGKNQIKPVMNRLVPFSKLWSLVYNALRVSAWVSTEHLQSEILCSSHACRAVPT